MNRLLAVNLSMALLVALGLLACDRDEKPTGPNRPAPTGPATAHPPALVSPHSGPSQLPEPGDIALPDLLPGPSGSAVPRPSLDLTDLEQVTEVVWGSILGTEPSDPVVSGLLADVPVLMSGIRQIKGRTYLYLGIGRAYFNRHGGERIYNTLTRRFPTVPLYIEPSDGVQPLSATRAAQQAASPTDTLLADPFQAGLGTWTMTSTGTGIGWRAQAFDETPVPGAEAGNLVAVAQTADCPENCALTLTTPLDLSRYSSVTLSFDRWVDDALGAGAFLAVELGNHGAYTRLDTWTDADGDSTWHRETYVIDAADLSSAVTVRFIAQPDNPLINLFDSFFGGTGSPTPKTLAIDNVVIAPAPGAVILERNLTVQSVTASPTPVASGDQVLLQVTIVNDGDATASSQSVRVYRHTARTTDPTAGTRVGGRATTGSLAAGASVTESVAVTAPTVSSETTYFYYVCIADHCSTTPAEVVVRPAPEPAQGPHLTVTSVAAIPTTVKSGNIVTIRATITNDGNASVSSETVRVYRHRSATTNPTSGTPVGSTTTGTLAAGASTTASVQITAPTVTEQTTYHYYVCTDDTCASAQVTVQPKPVVELPVVEPLEVMGGSYVEIVDYAANRHDVAGYARGTLTLCGLTTTDGTKGCVLSGHVAAAGIDIGEYLGDALKSYRLLFGFGDSKPLGDANYHLVDSNFADQVLLPVFLGKLMRIPAPRKFGDFNKFFDADAAFVAYPSLAPDCSLTWREDPTDTMYCLDLGRGEQMEPVPPLAIRGKNGAVYNVVGSKRPTVGLEAMFSGSTSGVVEGNRVTSEAMLTLGIVDGSFEFSHIIGGGEAAKGGDSGAPAYTMPDKDGNVHIVGKVTGSIIIVEEEETIVSVWSDVMKELDLRPISP